MVQKLELQLIQALYTDARFEALWRALDRLHDAASEGRLDEITTLPTAEVVAWLREIAYTAQETIHEIDSDNRAESEPQRGPMLQFNEILRWQERRASNVAKAGRGTGGT
jgi:hypothetical protein